MNYKIFKKGLAVLLALVTSFCLCGIVIPQQMKAAEPHLSRVALSLSN